MLYGIIDNNERGEPLGESIYRIGELARAASVNRRTVDYYTRIGLLRPETRTDARYRLYGEVSLRRLRTIQELRAQNFSLEEIRGLLDRDPANAITEATRLQADLDQMLNNLQELRGSSLDAKTRSALAALALKGMALAQRLLIVLSPEDLASL